MFLESFFLNGTVTFSKSESLRFTMMGVFGAWSDFIIMVFEEKKEVQPQDEAVNPQEKKPAYKPRPGGLGDVSSLFGSKSREEDESSRPKALQRADVGH